MKRLLFFTLIFFSWIQGNLREFDIEELHEKGELENKDINFKTILLVQAIRQGGSLLNQRVTLLLRYGAKPILQTNAEDTPAHAAVKYKRYNIVQLFLEKGVNPDVRNRDNQTLLDILFEKATQWYDPDWFSTGKVLLQYGVPVTARNSLAVQRYLIKSEQ